MINYVFKRYELKYLLDEEQYNAIKSEVEKHMSPDEFGETTIQSLYYDTDNYRLIRASIEKPNYKEKIRLRCYGINDGNKDVYLEMKRKADGVVYKRRIALKEDETKDVFDGIIPSSQIGWELCYFFNFYENLSPKVLILYDRIAYFDEENDLEDYFTEIREAYYMHKSYQYEYLKNSYKEARILQKCKKM